MVALHFCCHFFSHLVCKFLQYHQLHIIISSSSSTIIIIYYWLASKVSETLSGVTQLKIRDISLYICGDVHTMSFVL